MCLHYSQSIAFHTRRRRHLCVIASHSHHCSPKWHSHTGMPSPVSQSIEKASSPIQLAQDNQNTRSEYHPIQSLTRSNDSNLTITSHSCYYFAESMMIHPHHQIALHSNPMISIIEKANLFNHSHYHQSLSNITSSHSLITSLPIITLFNLLRSIHHSFISFTLRNRSEAE